MLKVIVRDSIHNRVKQYEFDSGHQVALVDLRSRLTTTDDLVVIADDYELDQVKQQSGVPSARRLGMWTGDLARNVIDTIDLDTPVEKE